MIFVLLLVCPALILASNAVFGNIFRTHASKTALLQAPLSSQHIGNSATQSVAKMMAKKAAPYRDGRKGLRLLQDRRNERGNETNKPKHANNKWQTSVPVRSARWRWRRSVKSRTSWSSRAAMRTSRSWSWHKTSSFHYPSTIGSIIFYQILAGKARKESA